MASLTLSIPADLKQKMAQLKYINWSAIARDAISSKIQMLEHMDRLLAKSALTEVNAIANGRKVNKAVSRKHKTLT